MGHVPARPLRLLGPGRDVQGRQRGGASREGDIAIAAADRARQRRDLGTRGEDLAAAWYREHGYAIVDRNWRCQEGELDVVARKGRTTVFCEVKARTSVRFGAPAEAVTPAKQLRLRRLAARWLAAAAGDRRGGGPIRFDVATVLGAELCVLEGAF